MRLRVAAYFLPVAALAWLGVEHPRDLLPDVEAEGARRIIDARRSPFSSIGKLKGSMGCTGVLVLDPRIVVTAAHCVADTNGFSIKEGVSFRLDYQAGINRGTFHGHVERVGSIRQYAGHTARDEPMDWAIIVLDETPFGVRPFALRNLHGSDLKRSREQIFLPTYPADMTDADSLSVDRRCSILDIRWEVFIHDCKASAGSSGAPLMLESEGSFTVVGIYTASLYIPGRNGEPGEFKGAAVRSSSFEAAVLQVYDSISRRCFRPSDGRPQRHSSVRP